MGQPLKITTLLNCIEIERVLRIRNFYLIGGSHA